MTPTFESPFPIMNPTTGYYSLIQYCPDRMKLEVANLGVLVFEPASRYLDALVAELNERIVRFFGDEAGDLEQIDAMKRMLLHRFAVERERIGTVEDLAHFAELLANEIVVTPPRVMRVENPETELRSLFEVFMGSATRPIEP